jgi:hypothetical protein
MPIEYHIDPQTSAIRTTCTGFVTVAEVLDHFDILERDPQCPPRLDVLLDLTEVTSFPKSHQIWAAAKRVSRVERVAFRLCAVATASSMLFGMLRMFEIFTSSYFEELRVFRDLAQAETWLQVEQQARGGPA